LIEQLEGLDLDPEMVDAIVDFFEMSQSNSALIILVLFGVSLLVGLIFSTIGGLIGGAVFKVEPSPSAPSGMGQPPAPPGSPPQV
jgi:hypothetical protein